MDDNLATIATPLRRIQEEGGDGNFVIFVADEEKNYYIQFVAARGAMRLYAEAASNDFVSQGFVLGADQIALLQSIGWEPPTYSSPNFHRVWEAADDNDRLLIANEVMRAFVEVYGLSPNQSLDVKLALEDLSDVRRIFGSTANGGASRAYYSLGPNQPIDEKSEYERKNTSSSRPRIPERVRIEVWRRDEGKCVKCGSREKLEYDHIIPLSKGGSNTARNIELLCEKCNRSKGGNIG